MALTRVLLTGRTGQLGLELQRALAPVGAVTAVASGDCDFFEPSAINALLNAVRPEVIVNAGAFTAVDNAEFQRNSARAINSHAPGHLGQWAARNGAMVVHYSTDYVFDGTKQEPYVETDTTGPLSVYGRTKRDGEVALRRALSAHLILRTSWLAGANGSNFLKTIVRLAKERHHLRVVSDQFGSPTSAALIADVTAHVLRQWICAGTSSRAVFPYGTYHVANSGKTSWHKYARFIVSEAQAKGVNCVLQPTNIIPVSTAEYPTAAPRPLNSQLNCEEFQRKFALRLPPWNESLRNVLSQILGNQAMNGRSR